MRRLLFLTAFVLASYGTQPARAACLKANAQDQTAEGKLLSVRIRDEAYQRTEQAYILQLRAPACLDGPDDIDKVEKSDRIHLFTLDRAMDKRVRGLVGKAVRVRGEPFGEHTAHHHAPIVLRLGAIEALPRP